MESREVEVRKSVASERADVLWSGASSLLSCIAISHVSIPIQDGEIDHFRYNCRQPEQDMEETGRGLLRNGRSGPIAQVLVTLTTTANQK